MKQYRLARTCSLAAALLAVSAITHAHDGQHAAVVYAGEGSAKGLCAAIVEDDVLRLKGSLRSLRSSGHRTERVHEQYECNSMALDEFAFSMGSDATGSYLESLYEGPKGTVRIEQVGSIEE